MRSRLYCLRLWLLNKCTYLTAVVLVEKYCNLELVELLGIRIKTRNFTVIIFFHNVDRDIA